MKKRFFSDIPLEELESLSLEEKVKVTTTEMKTALRQLAALHRRAKEVVRNCERIQKRLSKIQDMFKLKKPE